MSSPGKRHRGRAAGAAAFVIPVCLGFVYRDAFAVERGRLDQAADEALREHVRLLSAQVAAARAAADQARADCTDIREDRDRLRRRLDNTARSLAKTVQVADEAGLPLPADVRRALPGNTREED